MRLEGTAGGQALIRPPLEGIEHGTLVADIPCLSEVLALLQAVGQPEHLPGVSTEVTSVHIADVGSVRKIDRHSCCLLVKKSLATQLLIGP